MEKLLNMVFRQRSTTLDMIRGEVSNLMRVQMECGFSSIWEGNSFVMMERHMSGLTVVLGSKIIYDAKGPVDRAFLDPVALANSVVNKFTGTPPAGKILKVSVDVTGMTVEEFMVFHNTLLEGLAKINVSDALVIILG